MREKPDRRVELLDAVTEALRGYERDGEVVIPSAAWVVQARERRSSGAVSRWYAAGDSNPEPSD